MQSVSHLSEPGQRSFNCYHRAKFPKALLASREFEPTAQSISTTYSVARLMEQHGDAKCELAS